MISDAERPCLLVGLKQVKKALADKRARKVFLAEDCDMRLKGEIEELCSKSDISPIYIETMINLGNECGIDVKASCACVCE